MSGSIVEISQLATPANANLTDIIPATQGSIGPGTGTTNGVTVQQIIGGGLAATFGATHTGALTVVGATGITGAVTVTGVSSLVGNVSVTGTLTSSGALTVSGGGAAITGATTNNGAVTITSGGLTIGAGGFASTGNSSVTGSLSVSNGISVAGGGMSISGTTNLTGNLSASGTLTAGTGVIVTSGSSTFGGAVGISSGGISVSGNSGITGQLTVSAGLVVSSAGFSITGICNLTGTLAVSSNMTIGGTLQMPNGASTPFGGGWSYDSTGGGMLAPGTYSAGIICVNNVLANSFLASSDEDLKINKRRITPEEGLDWVVGALPYEYQKDGLWEWGFMAQDELRRGNDKVVSWWPREKMPARKYGEYEVPEGFSLNLDRTNPIAQLVAAVQALASRVEELEANQE